MADVRRKVDFALVNRAAISALPNILARLVPGGRIRACEYIVKNPTRADRHPGSFRINMRTGRWADFATEDRGGDPVSLVAFLEGVPQPKAARLLGQMLSIDVEVGK
jgi:hypothetical protein